MLASKPTLGHAAGPLYWHDGAKHGWLCEIQVWVAVKKKKTLNVVRQTTDDPAGWADARAREKRAASREARRRAIGQVYCRAICGAVYAGARASGGDVRPRPS